VELFIIKDFAGTIQKVMLLTIKPTFIRPRVTLRAKKDKFVEPAEAPGEGKRRPPNEEENLASKDDKSKDLHPLKKFIMDVFKIEEIDYEKFNKENMWAIRPNKKD
jgi:hypothetical protein